MIKSAFLTSVNKEVLKKTDELGLNHVIVGYKSINAENVSLMRENLNLEVHVETRIFAGPELTDKFEDAHLVEAAGKEVKKDAYCPTHEGVRKFRLNEIKKHLELDIDGLWLDSIRYPSSWGKPEPDLLDTCYCDRCLSLFEDYIGEKVRGDNLEETALKIDGLYYHEWLKFKTGNITSFVKEVKGIIESSNKNIILGVFVVPWEAQDHGAGIKRILGQDFDELAEYVDMIGPMTYHRMCGQPVEWIKEKVEYFWNVGIPFLPLVQTENRVGELSGEEFKKSLENAVEKPSSGVCVFFLENLIEQPEKYKVYKEFNLTR